LKKVLIPFQLYFDYLEAANEPLYETNRRNAMNQRDYVAAISEDADTLLSYERQATHHKERERLQLLRLLKSGQAMTIPQAATLVGISRSTAQRHWRQYQSAGLEAMCALWYKGGQSRLSAAALTQLEARCAEGFTNLAAAVAWVHEMFAVSYTQAGLWALFQRLGYKRKTGRPQHYKQDPEAQAAFKKNFSPKPTR
jgi:transposase